MPFAPAQFARLQLALAPGLLQLGEGPALPLHDGEPQGQRWAAAPRPWAGPVHEVLGENDTAGEVGGPQALVLHWVRDRPGQIAWIGRRIWPYPQVLGRAGLLRGSLFVGVADVRARLWAAELGLRSGAVSATVIDGHGFDFAATRRLQLAARTSGAVAFLVRREGERRQPSAAGVRWRVRCAQAAPPPAPARDEVVLGRPLSPAPRWKVDLLCCKGRQPSFLESVPGHGHSWTFEWQGSSANLRLVPSAAGPAVPVGLPANVAGRPRASRGWPAEARGRIA